MARHVLSAGLLSAVVLFGWAVQRYPVTGLIVKVDREHQAMVVSHREISAFMGAMVMPFRVRKAQMLEGMQPGMKVDFTLVVDSDSSYADDVRFESGDSTGRDPQAARRLQLLDSLVAPAGVQANAVAIGQPVPDFELTDQQGRRVSLSQFSGKGVAVTFVYTRCPLPDYCLRLSNNFARLQKRFQDRLGRELIRRSITFDPKYDQPAVLANYARTWNADADAWRFLTGSPNDTQRVYGMFGVNAFADEGQFTHSLRTAVIDRRGKLAAILPGNEFLPQQLGDLVASVMDH